MIILHQNCEPELAKDKSLPRDSYIVTYINEEKVCYDIVKSSTQVEIFDYYHDNAFKVKDIRWTDGTINPKIYGYVAKEPKKRKR